MHITAHFMQINSNSAAAASQTTPTDTAALMNSFEKDKKRKQSIVYSIRRGFFSHVRYLLENTQTNPNEIYQANENSSVQITTTSLLPTISNNHSLNSSNQSNSLPIISNLNQIVSSIYSCNGRTPLMFCSSIEDEAWSYGIAQNLIEKGAKVGQKDPHGLNALMYACMHQRKNLVRLYLNAPGDYNILSYDNFGNTAMHIAALGQMQSICKILVDTCIKYDINPLTDIPKNKFGHLPFDLCVANGHKSCIENYQLVREHFASRRPSMQNTATTITLISRILTANPVSHQRTAPITSSSALGDYSSSASKSSSHSNHMNHSNFYSVNCPSILFENSETNLSRDSSSLGNHSMKQQLGEEKQTTLEANILPSIHVTSASNATRSLPLQQPQTQVATNSTTSTSVSNNSSHSATSAGNMSSHPHMMSSYLSPSFMEIYKSIYPYKEPQIKVNINEIKKTSKTPQFVKTNIYELRPINQSSLKSIVQKKPKIKIEPSSPQRALKSAAVVVIKKPDEEASYFAADSQPNFRSASSGIIYSQQQSNNESNSQQQTTLENPQTLSTWKSHFNQLFDCLELQTSDSYRKSFQYSATAFDRMVGFQTSNLTNMRRSSVNRRSITSTANINFNTGRKQSNVNSFNIAKFPVQMSRRPSVTSNS